MLKQSSRRIKKILASLLVVFFVVSVTAAVVIAEPVVSKDKNVVAKEIAKEKNVVAKEKKKEIMILKDAKTKLFKVHHSKKITTNGKKGKDMGAETKTSKETIAKN